MSSIMDFQAQMKNFMRPNKFTVEISKTKAGSAFHFDMACFQAQIPGSTIATTDKDMTFRSVAYQAVYSDIILGFYANSKLKELKFWQDWIESIHYKKTNQWAYYNDYVGQIRITPINRRSDNVASWTLHDAYPKQIDPIQLDYGTNDAVMTINATITYRHFTAEWQLLVNEKDVVVNGADESYTDDQHTDLSPHNITYNNLKQIHRNETNEVFMARQLSGPYDYANDSSLDPTAEERKHQGNRMGGAKHMVAGKLEKVEED